MNPAPWPPCFLWLHSLHAVTWSGKDKRWIKTNQKRGLARFFLFEDTQSHAVVNIHLGREWAKTSADCFWKKWHDRGSQRKNTLSFHMCYISQPSLKFQQTPLVQALVAPPSPCMLPNTALVASGREQIGQWMTSRLSCKGALKTIIHH